MVTLVLERESAAQRGYLGGVGKGGVLGRRDWAEQKMEKQRRVRDKSMGFRRVLWAGF
jgi:hypothetical protein